MIQEDYVSFEIGKLLKEKGFNVNCKKYYNLKLLTNLYYGCEYVKNSNLTDENDCCAPTLQMAMRWLREDKKLSIIIDICFDDDRNNTSGYFFDVWSLAPSYDYFDTPIHVFDTYEEACEAAIKYCLENLI